MIINNKALALLCVVLMVGISSCAHESKVLPSEGHIDGQSMPGPAGSDLAADKTSASAAIPKPVTSNTYLPPPQPKAKEPIYSIVVYNTPVKEVLFAIARDSKLNVDIHPSVQGNVTLNAVDQTLLAILERLSRQVDLTYKVQSNVLIITPDQPVLRTYKVDYVNMNRDTKGFIGAAAEISSTGQAASTGAGGSTTTTSTAGNGANNSSRTSVTSEAKNHLWESLIQNIKELLAETDKEVIVTRYGSLGGSGDKVAKDGAENEKSNNKADKDLRDEQRSEYKTLLAANVIANPETGVISVRATNKQHEKIQEFLDKVLSSAKKQVLIEATIVEVRLSDSFQAGIDWRRLGRTGAGSGFTLSQTLNADGFKTGSLTTRGEGLGLIAGYFNPISPLGDIAASINLLKQFGDTKVLSSPKMMVLNNQTAVLKVVDNLVYFTVQAQQTPGTVSSQPFTTITTTPNTVPVGVVMSVTPQISDTNMVNVNVRPTISRAVGKGVQDPNPSLNNAIPSYIPQIQVREMESILQISSGSTAVLGGLMQDEMQRNSDKVPGLSGVPGLGKLFTGKDDANSKTELVIFLRPTVITSASLESDELAAYKQYLPSQQLEKTLEADGER